MDDHPNEAAYIAFAKNAMTEEYMRQLARYIQTKYPGSADRVLPKLREIYKQKFRGKE